MDFLISVGGLLIANKSKDKISLSADIINVYFCIELFVEHESTNL